MSGMNKEIYHPGSYYGHSANQRGQWQLLKNHLINVARRACAFASAFDCREEGRLAGLLHDLGKYGDRFQLRLIGKEHSIDHWSAGAWAALTLHRSIAAAMAIHGHHVGLQILDKDSFRTLDPQWLVGHHPLGLRLSEPDLRVVIERQREDGLHPTEVRYPVYGPSLEQTASAMLDVRMLFSALVDADYLDTEAHMRQRRSRGKRLDAMAALGVLSAHVAGLASEDQSSEEVRGMRSELWEACQCAGPEPGGVYTLSAPTGAGKTLAMLGFALKHAAEHGLRRVVIVVPYLSIIDQTVKTYRAIFEPHFGPEYILEHHSMARWQREPDRDDRRDWDAQDEARQRERALAENWDAPIVITTSVQILESLFSNGPSACRKLHRLARSVILFDEVQTLPLSLVIPTLQTLSRLASDRYHTSVVFSTATQPAFPHLDGSVRELGNLGWQPREVVSSACGLFHRVKRTKVEWPDEGVSTPWAQLVDRIQQLDHGRVLCIVNLKRHAAGLVKLMVERGVRDVWHLATSMCPAHRETILAQVRARLKGDSPCRLVATQCVEAGVDLDFPVVYRALGPLDAIAQAAGRCNRNGKQMEDGKPAKGQVVVFRPEEDAYPDRGYQQAAAITDLLLKELQPDRMDIDDPALFTRYYRDLYEIARPEQMREELLNAIQRQDFTEVARLYRLIDTDMINVLVPYPHAIEHYDALVESAQTGGLTAQWIRRARPYSIGCYRPSHRDDLWNHLTPVTLAKGHGSSEWFIYWGKEDYDMTLGLCPSEQSGACFG